METYSRVALRQLAEVERHAYNGIMFFVYAIYNSLHDKIYIGQTADLEERMRLHNKHVLGGYTARFDGEWTLIHKEEFKTRLEALKREKQLKSFRGRESIRKNIPE